MKRISTLVGPICCCVAIGLALSSAAVAGQPKPTVKVTRNGRVLTLDYDLLDDAGQSRPQTDRSCPPRFVVTKDGQEIDSGSFQYG
ncbi:MAG: hypothetical protein HQ567_21490 [Candidatus Nealsonbacteria bacterium]|nr:hypothetical protein [Candidatus Nealsonbacteria bacterium]